MDVRELGLSGELTLDGRLVRIRGLLPMLIDLKAEGIEKFILPEENLEEALAVSGIILYPAKKSERGGGSSLRQ